MSASYDLPHVDRLTVGTVGPPGQRTFYLQAREGEQLVTLKLEKSQVAALAERLGSLLQDNPATSAIPEFAETELEEPVLAEWAVGTLGLSFDVDDDLVVLVCEELTAGGGVGEEGDEGLGDDDDDESRGAVARFGATRGQIAALAMRGAQLVIGGRPPCPLCGYPLDPRGHSCPKTNGHRPPLT